MKLTIKYAATFTLALSISSISCMEEVKSDRDKHSTDNNEVVITTTVDDENKIDFSFQNKIDWITASPSILPKGIERLSCEFADRIYANCFESIRLRNLTDGEHVFKATYRVDSQSYYQEFRFITENGRLISTSNSDTLDAAFIIQPIGQTSSLKSNAAVHKSKDLNLTFSWSIPESCTPRLWCSKTNDRWTICSQVNSQIINIKSTHIFSQFQSIKVKARCQEADFESNEIEFMFYGVSEQYKPLGLQKIDQGKYSLFRLERPLDCFGKLSFACRRAGSDNFAACSNLYRKDRGDLISIKAICSSSDLTAATQGPEFTL